MVTRLKNEKMLKKSFHKVFTSCKLLASFKNQEVQYIYCISFYESKICRDSPTLLKFTFWYQFNSVQRVMEQFTAVKTFYQNRENATQITRALRTILGRNEAPFESMVRRLMMKFKTTGSVATAEIT
ncbi:Hypothetical predicted protein [Octopus vulgaris]|uniref:DUF4817 domain-containing protein n=1 Tax=Octopus vulgaris TaxID=6645 RepID=A0AA36FDJ7_OCTVU|nr:Hypothetical predicted protein [Octopus vulgaris]